MDETVGILNRSMAKKKAKKLYGEMVGSVEDKTEYEAGEEISFIDPARVAAITPKNEEMADWIRKVFELNRTEELNYNYGHDKAKTLGGNRNLDYCMSLLHPDCVKSIFELVELTKNKVISFFVADEKPIGVEGEDWYALFAPRIEHDEEKWAERRNDKLREAIVGGWQDRKDRKDFDEEGSVRLSLDLQFSTWLDVYESLSEVGSESQTLLARGIKKELSKEVQGFIERNAPQDEGEE